jgi:Tfp pilus assembly protein PilN
MALVTKDRPAGVQVDLLPDEVSSVQKTKRTFRLAVYAAVGMALVLGGASVFQNMQISDARGSLAEAQAQAQSLRTDLAELAEFEYLQTSLEQNRALLGTALRGDLEFSRLLNDLDLSMPPGSWLTNLTVSSQAGTTPMGEGSVGTVQYQGFVPNFPGLSGWLDTMDALEGLTFVYPSSGNRQDQGGGQVVAFTATAHVTNHMLSGRCQQEGSLCP